ncbi:hypothetical protein [Methyloprofundus sp.]|uniref:hypothetical protein n=1 Tax=Methyloprofundus sp. TaxID=2020875 RepID=UPI003D0F7573
MNNNILLRRLQGFMEKTLFAKRYDKNNESDKQMLQRVGKRFAVLFFVILMFDTLVDWFLGLIDFVIHLLHLFIQAIEYSLLISLEHWFHFDQQQSETIVVNAAIIIALYLVYRLILATPDLTIRFKQYLRSVWLRHVKREKSCWQAMSLSHKIKWLSAYSFGTSCLMLLI